MANPKRDPLKNRWNHMFEKCNCETSRQYKDFGGRGITICEEWKDYQKFEEWSYANGYTAELDLELGRINQDGNFEPSNCRYITPEQQANNRRTCRVFTHKGITNSMKNLCRYFNKDYDTVRRRVLRGKSIEDAMNTDLPFVDNDKGRKR